MKYLVVGATSEAGRSAMEAIREFDPRGSIIATTSRDTEVDAADKTINKIDLSNADAADKILAAAEPVDIMFFTPAFGPVGYPIAETQGADVAKALGFSYEPLVRVARELPARLTVSYSSFYWLDHISVAYGSMGAAKYALEKLALDEPDRFRVIRSGTFFSKSTRGISLMIQRTLKTTKNPTLLSMVPHWKASGMKFQEYFFHYAHSVEREQYQANFAEPHRNTTREDLKQEALRVLRGEDGPIRNVIGDWKWTESDLPSMRQMDQAAITAHI